MLLHVLLELLEVSAKSKPHCVGHRSHTVWESPCSQRTLIFFDISGKRFMREFQQRTQGLLLLFNLDYTEITPLTSIHTCQRWDSRFLTLQPLFLKTCITKNQERSGQLPWISSVSPSLVSVVETQQGTATAISAHRAITEPQMVTIWSVPLMDRRHVSYP